MKKLKRCILGLAVGGLFAASCAHADTLVNPGAPNGLAFNFNNPAASSDVLGSFTVNNTTTQSSFVAYCLEVLQNISTTAVYTSSIFNNADVQALYDQRYGSLATAGSPARIQQAAFQIALWEILDTGNVSRATALTTGSVNGWTPFEQQALTLAGSWLTTLVDPTPGVNTYTLTRWSNGPAQDLLQATLRTQAVPLPSTLLLGLAGLLGLGAVRRQS
jgi:MYXO-CTERM domain-containing protein